MAGINLEKRAEHVGIVLAKHNITKTPTVRVGLALDVSGSTQNMFAKGIIQETTDRLLAMALKFDDNGELDVWAFSNGFNQLKQATSTDYNTYIKKNIIDNNNINKWGGTSYAPCMKDICEFYFGKSEPAATPTKPSFFGGLFGKKEPEPVIAPVNSTAQIPAMVLFVTDGENDDKRLAEQILKEAQANPVYWQLVGVGPASYFTFLQKMADDLPNVGFVNLSTLEMSDDQLYNELVSEEFCTWVKGIA